MSTEYCTAEDVLRLYKDTNIADLLDRDGTDDLARDPRFTAALSCGNSIVDGYVRKQQDLPLREIPGFLRGYAIFLTYWEIVTSSQRGKASRNDKEKYDEIIERLEDVAAHRIDLPFVSRTERNMKSSAGIAVVNKQSNNDNKIFGDASLSDYIKDLRS